MKEFGRELRGSFAAQKTSGTLIASPVCFLAKLSASSLSSLLSS
jgi:hypothetical protein